MNDDDTQTAAAPKTRKPRTELPYVVGQWLPDGKFKPCDVQPAQSITQFDEIVRWAVETLKGQPDQYNFVRRDPRTLQIAEQRTIKGTLV